jgi:hemolysin III
VGLKEPFNSISHMAGGGLALALVPLLVLRAHGPLAVTAASVYGFSLVTMYTMSALYHSIPHRSAQAWLFRLDQVGIYLLIAGTYTPVALVRVGGATGWTLFGIEWGLALAGIVLCLTVHRTPQIIHQLAYVALGWAAVTALPRLLAIPWPGLALLMGGGVLYTAGSLLYNRNRPQTLGPFGDHELWHLLVLGGSAAHAVFVVAYVL